MHSIGVAAPCQHLGLITEFFLCSSSSSSSSSLDAAGESLLLRIEDVFVDLIESDQSAAAASRQPTEYHFDRRTLHGFLFSTKGMYIRFPSNEFADEETSSSRSDCCYPSASKMALKLMNLSCDLAFKETETGFRAKARLALASIANSLVYEVELLQPSKSISTTTAENSSEGEEEGEEAAEVLSSTSTFFFEQEGGEEGG